ncbi:MAG: 23S rRNA pseudouridine(1911/1915/1917) synthase RluD [Enterobacterales bacterium]|nr:23S rRNA pseudouridine(1911/1915/1917) synthase RluD [Enterobacterales bacterium]
MAESSLNQNQNAQAEESYQVEPSLQGERLDFVLVHYYPELSRSRLQSWIKNGQVKLDGVIICKPKHKVLAGESLSVLPIHEDHGQWQATKMDLSIVYEDDDLLVVNKPVGLVVHPAPGHYQDTLVNGLLHAYPSLIKLPRAGIVHRLDKDTTGLLVVAKTAEAHHYLVDQLQQRLFQREYMALVHHNLVAGDSIDLPIGRHPQQRKKMAVVLNQSHAAKEAITHYRIERKFKHFTLLKVKLETGRTHQIRVHLSHIKHPIVGDPLYSVRNLKPRGMSPEFAAVFESFERQALHAYSLAIVLPSTGELMQWQAELPDDLTNLLKAIERHDLAASD